jgi:hypothetical protein
MVAPLLTVCVIGGCQTKVAVSDSSSDLKSTPKAVAPARPAIRIDAGATAQWSDAAGNLWLADTGFKDGETVTRDASMAIGNTSDQAIYRTERFSMTAFSQPVPNGKYTVKLHFAETSGAISGTGGRIFSVKVEEVEIRDLDIWAKAGARERAHVETLDVEVNDAKLDVVFTPRTQNPTINGIEIIPRS